MLELPSFCCSRLLNSYLSYASPEVVTAFRHSISASFLHCFPKLTCLPCTPSSNNTASGAVLYSIVKPSKKGGIHTILYSTWSFDCLVKPVFYFQAVYQEEVQGTLPGEKPFSSQDDQECGSPYEMKLHSFVSTERAMSEALSIVCSVDVL